VGENDVFYVLEKVGVADLFRKIVDAGTRIDKKIIVYECRAKTAVKLAALMHGRPVSRSRAEKEKFHFYAPY
jgi:hypothetical protein